jgi:predicted dehydrogenase
MTKRREFLKKVGTATVGLSLFPTIVKASVLGREGHVPPSDKITMILIGCGSMGRGDLNQFINFNEIQAIAVCDVDDNRLAMGKKIVDEKYGNTDCRIYKDFREILEKENANTAILALPEHWHALIGVAVANKKIDIYGEKPLTRYLAEGRAIVNAANRNNIVWQTGSQQRSGVNFHHAAELVINGRIGKVEYVEVGLPEWGAYTGNPPERPVPDGVDWDMWLGPAPKVPFRGLLHGSWRNIMDYSGGQLTDWGAHHIDIAHWGLGFDRTGPVTIEGMGRANNEGIYNVPVEFDFTCVFANGVKIRVTNQSKLEHGMGVLWKGTNGWIHVDRESTTDGSSAWLTRGEIKASDENILKEKIGKDETALYKSTHHQQNFIDCVKSREETIAPAEIGHRSISVAHLGEIAMITGQKLHWDPQAEKFTDNNMYATRLLKRPYREPWKFPE